MYHDADEQRSNDVEVIRIQAGWLGLTNGFFCLIEREGICVEDFGRTRTSVLRLVRKTWQKEKNKMQETQGYPRVRNCNT